MLKKTIKVTIDCPEIQNGSCQTPSDILFDFYINNKLIFSEFNLRNNFIEGFYEIDFDIEKTNILKLLSSSKIIESVKIQADVVDAHEFIISPNANYIKDINKVYDLLIKDLVISCHDSQHIQDYSDNYTVEKDYLINDKLKGTNRICKNIFEHNNFEFAELANSWNYTDKLSFKIIENYRSFNSQGKQVSQNLADRYTLTINVEII